MTYHNKATDEETLALLKGLVTPGKPTLVRMHTMLPLADTFGEVNERSGLLSRSMELIGEEGSGVIVVINHRTPDMITRFMKLRSEGKLVGAPEVEELRDYGGGAQILADLGVHELVLLTNSRQSLVALSGYGLSVVGERPIELTARVRVRDF